MKRSFRSVLVLVVAGLLGAVVAMGSVAGDAVAKSKGKGTKAAPAASSDAPKNDVNTCGCYRNAQGACFCAKKGKCGCPGECEPKGCEEKRNKEIKEIATETKRAADAEKKQRKGGDDQADEDQPAPKPRAQKR